MTHTNPDATQRETQTAQHDLQEANTCTTTLQIAKKKTESEQFTTPVDIAALIAQLCSSIDPRTRADDRDILCFCLHHLFLSIDTLSRVTYCVFTEQVSSTDESPPARMRNLVQQHAIWTRLREIKHILERIEPLCQLLNDASSAMLSSLDTQAISPSPTPPEESSTIQLPYEQFRDALTPVLDTWRQCLSQQHTFHHCFAHLLSATPTTSTTPTLACMDSAFFILLKSARSLFSDTLPAFSTTRHEATAALFLDLMQKIDQILLQVDVMMTPLQTLIKHHEMETEMS
jgi:hypothetical protein